MMFFVLIGLAAFGLMQEMRYGLKMMAEYKINPILAGIGGVGTTVALVGLALLEKSGHASNAVIFGSIVSVACQLSALKMAKIDVIKSKTLPMSSSERWKLSPLAVFMRTTVIGLGIVLHIILIFTIIGIPIYSGLKNSLANVDDMCEQVTLRNKLHAMEETTAMNEMKGKKK